MSKYLVKILSICAFVVMLPLVILGTALCVTESLDFKVRVFVDGNDAEYATCSVQINGQERENNELSLKKNENVTVSIVITGYDFEAWYQGTNVTYTENKTEVSKKETYSFVITDNTDLTAKIDVKKYNITFTGEYDDGSEIVEHTITYNYGERLETLQAKDEGVAFTGWVVIMDDGVSNSTYEFANFATSGSYTLKPTWSNQKKVSYFNAEGAQFATMLYSQRTFDKLTAQTILDEEAVARNTRLGYKFKGWSAFEGGEIINLAQYQGGYFTMDELNLYMIDELLEYDLTVALNDESSETSKMTYDVQHGFSEYTGSNDDYNFAGLKYKDVLYSYNKASNTYANGTNLLSDAILADYPHEAPETINLVAVWKEKERTVIYHNASGAIVANATLTKTEFEALSLPDVNNDIVKNNLSAGYKFTGWSAELGADTQINLDEYKGLNFAEESLHVYIMQTEVAYTLNVKYHALSDEITTIRYDVTNKYDKEMAERYYYDFVGLMFNDVLYTYNVSTGEYMNGTTTLSSVIVRTSPNKDVQLDCTAVWKSQFETINFSINAKTTDNKGIYAVKQDGTETPIVDMKLEMLIEDVEGKTTLETKVVDKLLSEYTGFYYESESDMIEVEFYQLRYEADGVSSTVISGAENMTIMQVLALLEENFGVTLASGMTIDIVLIFTPVA